MYVYHIIPTIRNFLCPVPKKSQSYVSTMLREGTARAGRGGHPLVMGMQGDTGEDGQQPLQQGWEMASSRGAMMLMCSPTPSQQA